VDDDLVAWGRLLRLETTGRVSGRPARATVGFAERDDGALLVAAGSPDADWARNLLAAPACRVTVGESTWVASAEPLRGSDHAHAVRELILKYGTPSEGLGSGPSFALRPAPIGRSGPGAGADRTTGGGAAAA
jgi:deazaflavin-dependent oxidoreductase (nitroreductase family)